MQVTPSGGQYFNSCKWRHLVAKFGTNASGATISWRDNSSLDAIPWVRCASGNVYNGTVLKTPKKNTTTNETKTQITQNFEKV